MWLPMAASCNASFDIYVECLVNPALGEQPRKALPVHCVQGLRALRWIKGAVLVLSPKRSTSCQQWQECQLVPFLSHSLSFLTED